MAGAGQSARASAMGSVLLFAAVWVYQRAWCRCTSPASCCQAGMLAARLLPARVALRVLAVGYGECRESSIKGTHR